MNILYLCDEYPPGRHGGIGTAVQLLAREMAKQGHHVVIAGFYDWGYGGEDEFMDGDVKVYRFRRGLDTSFFAKKDKLIVRAAYRLFRMTGIFQWDISRSLDKYNAFLERIIATHHIDIIEAPDFNEYVQFCTKVTPFPKLSKPTIVKLHGSITFFSKETGDEVSSIIERMEKEVVNNAAAVVSVSRYAAQKTSIYFDYSKPIDVLYNGIHTDNSIPNVKKDDRLVVFSGSLVAKKGIYQLMKAWNIVHKRLPDTKLYIYGKGPIARVQEHLTSESANSVVFKGHVCRSELFAALAKAQVAIFPSYSESFGLAVVEAMNCKTAVIFTKRPPGPEIVEDKVDGLLIDPDDVDGIASSICFLLNNPDVCDRLAMHAKQTVLQKFDIAVIAQQHAVFYSKIVQ